MKVVTKGTKTTTGGEVLEGLPNITIGGQPVATVGMKASCKSGDKNCKGLGVIAQTGDHVLTLSNGQKAALGQYIILCGCNKNFICEPSHNIVAHPGGMNITIGEGVNVQISSDVNITMGGDTSHTNPPKYRNPQLDRQLAIYDKVMKKHAARKAAQASLDPSKLVGLASGSGAEHVSEELAGSLSLECSLEDALNENHQQVAILDEVDSHILLHNIWVDMGRHTLALATFINNAKSWGNHIEPIFDAAGLVKEFKDLNLTVDLVKNKAGKWCYAFASKKNPDLKHVLANGTRININRKFPLNSLKMTQLGLSPQVKLANFKGSAALTFILSASIATTNLVFNDDYHLVDWVGNVGSDMFKALVQYGAGEIGFLFGIRIVGTVLSGGIAVAVVYLAIEYLWGEYDVSEWIVGELENVIEN
ncbi:TPA: PAAR domain-containing protein [Vibrio parahaemolyticus]